MARTHTHSAQCSGAGAMLPVVSRHVITVKQKHAHRNRQASLLVGVTPLRSWRMQRSDDCQVSSTWRTPKRKAKLTLIPPRNYLQAQLSRSRARSQWFQRALALLPSRPGGLPSATDYLGFARGIRTVLRIVTAVCHRSEPASAPAKADSVGADQQEGVLAQEPVSIKKKVTYAYTRCAPDTPTHPGCPYMPTIRAVCKQPKMATRRIASRERKIYAGRNLRPSARSRAARSRQSGPQTPSGA